MADCLPKWAPSIQYFSNKYVSTDDILAEIFAIPPPTIGLLRQPGHLQSTSENDRMTIGDDELLASLGYKQGSLLSLSPGFD